MKVDKINAYLDQFADTISPNNVGFVQLLSDCSVKFNKYWDMSREDFAYTYNKGLDSSMSRRLWKDHDYYPKDIMLAFIQEDPDFIKSMFRSLFDEDKEVEGRVSRFLFSCDELLTTVKVKSEKIRDHYHSNRSLVSLYLTLNNPDKYFQTDYDTFNSFLVKVESKQALIHLDLDRVAKVSKVLNVFMNKHQPLLEKIATTESKLGMRSTNLSYWKSEFISFVAFT